MSSSSVRCPVWGDLGEAKSVAATLAVNDCASFYSQTDGDWTPVRASQPTLSRQRLEPSFRSIGCVFFLEALDEPTSRWAGRTVGSIDCRHSYYVAGVGRVFSHDLNE
jgi:hypothetical protein